MVKFIKLILIFAFASYGLSGCATKKELAAQAKTEIEQAKENKTIIDKQNELTKKVDLLEISIQEWQMAKPDVERLVSIENELRQLISQLNSIVDEAPVEPEAKPKMQAKPKPEMQAKTQPKVSPVPVPVIKTPAKEEEMGGFYALQLISVSNVKAVESSWNKIMVKNSDILLDFDPLIEEVIVNNRKYYRVKTGKFISKIDAKSVCKQLAKKNTSCLVSPYSGQTLTEFKLENGL